MKTNKSDGKIATGGYFLKPDGSKYYVGSMSIKNLSRETIDKIIEDISYERLLDICNAEREERLVILPCEVKVGDMVYEPNKRGFISTHHITSIIITRDSINYKSELISGVYIKTSEFNEDTIGNTIFLTQAEAEKSLAERKENG